MKPRHKRLAFILVGLAGIAIATTLIMKAFNENMMYFFSPSDVISNKAPADRGFRLGGIVEEDSVRREDDGLTVHFLVTDRAETVAVTFTGILPDLFKEGQSVIAQGRLDGGEFFADEVLAKHDETYMPPEVAEAIERAKEIKEQQAVEGGSITVEEEAI